MKKDYDVPLRSMAYVLYNAAKRGISDPELYENYEKQMPFVSDSLTPREAFGGMYAYYRSSLGTPAKILPFEKMVETNFKRMRIFRYKHNIKNSY